MAVVKGENSLMFATGVDNSGLKRGSADAVGIIKGLGNKISKINPFAALAIGAVAAFGIIANGAYKMAKNFEHAMKEVETISSAVQKDFEGISSAVFALSKITPDSPEKLAKAYYQIVSAGHDGAKGLKLLEIAAKAAVAGVTDTETAADGITTVMNAFKLEAEDSERVADIFFKTVQLGKTTFGELASNMSTVAPIAAAMGVPFEQVAAAVASLTKQGTPTAQAMTQIRSALIGTNEALGDGWSEALTLQEAFQLLFEEADGSQTVLQEMVGRIEAVSGVLGVAGKNAKAAAKDLEDVADAAGSTNKAFETMASSNINQIDILKNRIKASTKGIGDAVVDMANDIAGGLNELFQPLDAVVAGLQKQRVELLSLESAVKDTNTTTEDRIELIKKLKEQYPDLLEDIDAETISNKDLAVSIELINKQLINKIVLAKQDAIIQEQAEEAAEKDLEKVKFTLELRQKVALLHKQNGVELRDQATLREQALEILGVINKKEGERGQGLSSATLEFAKQIQHLEVLENQSTKEAEKTIDLQQQKIKILKELGIVLDDNAEKPSPEIDAQLAKIKAITIDQYESNKNILKEYLDSENKEIAKAAEKRKKLFDFKFKTGDDDKTFADFLKKKAAQYEHYTLAVQAKENELAAKLKKEYELEEETYYDFLLKKYNATKENADKILVLNELVKEGYEPRQVAVSISSIKPAPIVVDVKLDVNSINSINARLTKLNSDFNKAQTEADKKRIGEQIKIEEKRLEAAEKFRNKEKDTETELVRHISDMSNIALRSHIDTLRKRLAKHTLTAKQIKNLEDEIKQSQEQIGSNTADAFSDVASTLRDAGALFTKFGDEDLAKALDQMAGVAEGAATLAQGIATSNPLAIISGGLQILDSALTVEIVSDTAKFEKAVKELEKAIDKLDYVISKSVGSDRVSNRIDSISELEELEKQADLARKAELDARKETKLLGITIGKKGKGSGTDAAKLEELEQKAEDARRKAAELKDQLDQLYTGVSEQTIVDNIIAGLKEGKKSVADFANDFKTLIQDALLQAFQIKYLEKEIEKFYDLFASAGSDGNYSAAEIDRLREFYNNIISGAESDLDAINAILDASGIGALGSEDNRGGLQGAIRREMTEETGAELTGLFRGYYDLSKQHFELAQQALGSTNNIVQLSEEIANNTFETVEQLKLAIVELKSIGENTQAHYLLDLG